MTMLVQFIDITPLYRFAAPLLLVALIAWLLHNKYGHGINSIPGPLAASVTNLWRLALVTGRRPELEHIKLHRKYGNIVRLGPNVVSVSDPNAVKVIYAINAGFVKVSSETTHFLIAIPSLCTKGSSVTLLHRPEAHCTRWDSP
jgi:hypothetical protein